MSTLILYMPALLVIELVGQTGLQSPHDVHSAWMIFIAMRSVSVEGLTPPHPAAWHAARSGSVQAGPAVRCNRCRHC
ncbi:MAG: hypothetical protein AW07_02431 [Candidatus Accumulibacter sp. SK-11]|nr:MAG: hypothetical protein AW07_02431 [Candidatus Accumulibacter sp. SK-11]